MVKTTLTADYDGRPLQVLEGLVQQRMQYLHQTAVKALDATAVTLLRSLRSLTKVAKVEKIKIEQVSELKVSFEKNGMKARPCLRYKGSDVHFYPGEKDVVRFTASSLVDSKGASVFSFLLGYGRSARRYYVGACSAREARELAREIQKRRLNSYKGLAKLAIGTLMRKIASTSLNDNTSQRAGTVARQNTRITRGDGYLQIDDELNYAELAFKHGKADLDVAAAKAANSIAAMINKRLANTSIKDRLSTPFTVNA